MSFIETNFLLKMVTAKNTIHLIHQIGNEPKYSFTFSRLCFLSVKWIFFIYRVFEIESCLLGRWCLGWWVGGRSVVRSVGQWVSGRWSVGWWSVGRLSVDLTTGPHRSVDLFRMRSTNFCEYPKSNCLSKRGFHHRCLYSKAYNLTFNRISKILRTVTITKISFSVVRNTYNKIPLPWQ